MPPFPFTTIDPGIVDEMWNLLAAAKPEWKKFALAAAKQEKKTAEIPQAKDEAEAEELELLKKKLEKAEQILALKRRLAETEAATSRLDEQVDVR